MQSKCTQNTDLPPLDFYGCEVEITAETWAEGTY